VRAEGGGASGERLQSLVAISAGVSAIASVDALLDVIAEQAREAVGAASLSISRLLPDASGVQTLVNVGDLGPGEVRHPTDEVYLFSDLPRFAERILSGQPYLACVDDPDIEPACRETLLRLRKESSLTVPIIVDGKTWGELWAATAPGTRRVADEDATVLFAVAAHVADAIAQAEHVSLLSSYAYTDPLTGLLNRRGLLQRLQPLVELGSPVSVAVCDLDGLKAVNDSHGHAAGDRALIRAAEALRWASAVVPGAFAARLGGDEFCVAIDGGDVTAATRVARVAVDRLAADRWADVRMSAGVASTENGWRSTDDLLRAADAALYTAKVAEPGGVRAEEVGSLFPLPRSGHGFRQRRPPRLEALMTGAVARLDATEGRLARLRVITSEAADVLGALRAYVIALPSGVGRTTVERVLERPQARLNTRAIVEWAIIQHALLRPLAPDGAAVLLQPDDDTWPISAGIACAVIRAAESRGPSYVVRLDLPDAAVASHPVLAALRLLVTAATHGAGSD
jgi:diguanylate cyclase (GGDEF)-like protein